MYLNQSRDDTLMKYLILTTLPHYLAILPLLGHPSLTIYACTIFLSTTMSILYHASHESNGLIMYADYIVAFTWFLYDLTWGLTLTPYAFFLVLLLNGLVFLANQSIDHDEWYPVRHSLWHLFSACKCICIATLLSHTIPSKALVPYSYNMAFVQAMNASDTKIGVNGAATYTEEGVGDRRVTLFTMLNRGLEEEYIKENIYKCIEQNDPAVLHDLWVMAFQTRDVRGGKGERQLFYQMFQALHQMDSERATRMVPLIPTYGCWRDLWEIGKRIPELEATILQHTQEVYIRNMDCVRKGEPIDLLGKWLPREKSKTYPGWAQKIATCVYYNVASLNTRMRFYRLNCSEMNRALKTVEVNMCGKTWAAIEPEAVPGRCLKIHDAAFLNVRTKDHNTIRYPNDGDRMTCRAHFQDFTKGLQEGTKKAHGANVVLPHELVVKLETDRLTSEQEIILQAQWDSVKEETIQAGGLGKTVAMCDFSGSMSGIPLEISKALGILISECTHPAFRDYIMTFDSTPHWHSFKGKKTLKEKVESLTNCGIGLSTDFYKACKCIISRMVQHNVPVGEEPDDLLVITDMGFDAAATTNSSSSTQSAWETQLTRIRREFQSAGGWKPPRIVIWNVRAAFKDFHATADQEGVVQISGWSPSILKALQKGVQVQTPYEGMRSVLDDERYDLVRLQL